VRPELVVIRYTDIVRLKVMILILFSGGAEMMVFLDKINHKRSMFRAEFYQLQVGQETESSTHTHFF
jgi:hypothetical protein